MLADRLRIIKTVGVRNTLKIAWRRIMRRRAMRSANLDELFSGKRGLEIGGPSILFEEHKPLPIYPILAELDNCLFAANTVWTPETRQGRNFRFDSGHRIGYQYICDGTNLSGIPKESYNCVLSCNSLEHIANPLKALKEWHRILTDSGAIIVIVPAKDYTFDHRRSITTLEHLVEDFRCGVAEDDLSHLDEILALHDLNRDHAAGNSAQFRNRCEQNSKIRCMHHHVFNTETLVSALDFAELQVCAVDAILPFHIAAVARKTRPSEPPDNRRFIDSHAGYRRTSPFLSDRISALHL